MKMREEPNRDHRITILLLLALALLLSIIFEHYNALNNDLSDPAKNLKKLNSFDNSIRFAAEHLLKDARFTLEPVPINVGTKEFLMSVSGVGPTLAERIITFRNTKGPIENAEQMLEIEGIGPKKYNLLKNQFSFSVSKLKEPPCDH